MINVTSTDMVVNIQCFPVLSDRFGSIRKFKTATAVELKPLLNRVEKQFSESNRIEIFLFDSVTIL